MISFVMLTWNRKRFVELMFSSFYKNISKEFVYEFLIIDNGSIDSSVELLKNYMENDPSIKVWFNKKNKGLEEYKKLFSKCKGEYIILIDDDVIEFPFHFDKIMVDYISSSKIFGILALDVIQNEYTNGAKPGKESYKDIVIKDKTVSIGPAGGWCAIFKRKNYQKIKPLFHLVGKLNMKKGEDSVLNFFFRVVLRLKNGIIKDVKCLHANGPYYSKQYGFLERDIEKYKISNLNEFVDIYKSHSDNKK